MSELTVALTFDAEHPSRPGAGVETPDKILDALGDLSLIGMPVIGQLTAVKSGHALNHQLVRRVLAEVEACEVVQPSAEDELHEIQERLLPVLALEEQVA